MVMWSKLMLRLILWDVYIKGVLQLFKMNALSFAQSINIILVGVWQPCWSFVYRDHSAPANNASSSLFTMHSSLVLVAASIAAHSHSLEWDIAVVNSKASIKHSERCMDKKSVTGVLPTLQLIGGVPGVRHPPIYYCWPILRMSNQFWIIG